MGQNSINKIVPLSWMVFLTFLFEVVLCVKAYGSIQGKIGVPFQFMDSSLRNVDIVLQLHRLYNF